jgi:hypothetical protein
MNHIEIYQTNAQDCVRLSERVPAVLKPAMLQMAEAWTAMALESAENGGGEVALAPVLRQSVSPQS